MNAVDQILCDANRENPILALLLGVLLDGGRFVSTGPKSEELLKMVSDILHFEKRDLSELAHFHDFTAKDCVFVEDCSVDQLLALNKATGSQIVHITQKSTDISLMDFETGKQQIRSALISLRPLYEKVFSIKGQIFLEGSRLNKALFLDRDGVIIEDTDYIREPSMVRILPTVAENLKKARVKGYKLFVVSNQSGMGRGLIHWSQYESVTERMQDLLVQEGVYFDRVLKAPYYEKSNFASGLIRKSLRKPRPGMIHQVVQEFRIDLEKSGMVGDSARDLIAGALAGIRQLFLVNSPKFAEQLEKWNQWPLRSRFTSATSFRNVESFDEILKELS